MMLLCEAHDEFSRHDKCLLVGETDFLVCPYGVYGGAQPGKAHHCGEYGIDGFCLHDFAKGLRSGIDLDVGTVGEEGAETVVVCLVGDDDGCRTETVCLFGELLHLAVCRQAVCLVEVGMFGDDFKSLCADGAGRTEYAYLLFHVSFCWGLAGWRDDSKQAGGLAGCQPVQFISRSPCGKVMVTVSVSRLISSMNSSGAGRRIPLSSSKRMFSVVSSTWRMTPTGLLPAVSRTV